MLEFDEYKIKLNNLRPDLESLGKALRLVESLEKISRLEEESAKEDFWADSQNSQRVFRELKLLRSKCDGFERLSRSREDLAALCEMAIEEGDDSMLPELESEYAALYAGIEEMRLSTLLSGEYDNLGAILSFHAGAGGTEAMDWAWMLYRMYTRWAERHGFKYKILDYLEGEEAGLKSAAISIEGENAYGYLKSEHGIHRLVRISPFDGSGRRHTSFAAIEVMPEITGEIDLEIKDEDLRVDTFRSGGAGGQHVNKTESAIRITHLPTGIVVSCQNERSQHQNRETAMRMLRSKLAEIKEREHLDRIEDIKGEQKAIEWGSQIRSYVFMPYTMAKDHRTNFESGNINAVMDGDLDGFITAYLSMKAGS